MAIEYKFEGYWSQQDGWRFSSGQKRLWQSKDKYIVAVVREEKGWEGERYSDHEQFDDLREALDFMRTGKRE